MPPPPHRTDHIGSLIRPKSLLDARTAANNAKDDQQTQQAARTAQSAAIADVVATQLSRGIQPITDGEFSRPFFTTSIWEVLDGVEFRFTPWSAVRAGDPTLDPAKERGMQGIPFAYAAAKIRHSKPAHLDAWLELRRHLPRERWADAKVTLLTPTWMHLVLAEGRAWDAGVYADADEYFDDVAAAYRAEIGGLYDAGVRHVQIDDPKLTMFCHEPFLRAASEDGTDVDGLLATYIRAHNKVLEGLPGDLAVGVHLCRGNYDKGVYTLSGSYERIADRLFNKTAYKLFYFEFDTERAGGFAPLRFLPRNKAVVLGLVTTKHADMEDLQALKAKVYEAADVIAKAQGRSREEVLQDSLAVSPQCGFSSSEQSRGVGMTEHKQWEKLELVKQLAKEIWG